jgi:hypothetical protein
MGRTFTLAAVCSLLIVSAASADLPLPKDIKYVDPRVRFEGIDAHADYVFHLRFLTFVGGPNGVPYTVIEVKDAKPFNLNAQRRLINMQLLAVERKEFEKRAKDEPSLKWLTDKTEGVLAAKVVSPSTTAPISIKEVPVTTYRVTLQDGKLKVELVEDKKRGQAAPFGSWPNVAFGVVSALSLAWFGIWFVRRGRASHERLAVSLGCRS